MTAIAPIIAAGPGTFSQRVEHKYWLPGTEFAAAVSVLQQFVPIYRYAESGDSSSVRTVYLDTPRLDCYRHYAQGLFVRWKVRIRQYGHNGQFGPRCWAEVK